MNAKLLDKRVAQRYLRKGLLDEKEWSKHLESLPDLADRAADVEARFEPTAAPRPTGEPRNEPGVDAAEE
jgi:hypothetical protein